MAQLIKGEKEKERLAMKEIIKSIDFLITGF